MCLDAGVLPACDLWEMLRVMAVEVGGLGEGIMAVGVAMDPCLGLEFECGRFTANGVAIFVYLIALVNNI